MTHEKLTPAPVEVTALACAHCGSEALIGQTLDDAWYAMCCVDHCIRIDKYWHTKAEAIAAWNTRHSAPAGEVEPVAWMYHHADLHEYEFIKTQAVRARCKQAGHFPCDAGWIETPLYAHPAPTADLVELVEAAKASIEGWNNVVEMGLLPPQHHDTARELSERLYAALAKHTRAQGER